MVKDYLKYKNTNHRFIIFNARNISYCGRQAGHLQSRIIGTLNVLLLLCNSLLRILGRYVHIRKSDQHKIRFRLGRY